MKSIKNLIKILLVGALFFPFLRISQVNAAMNCGNFTINIDNPLYMEELGKDFSVSVSGPFAAGEEYKLQLGALSTTDSVSPSGNNANFTLWVPDWVDRELKLIRVLDNNLTQEVCSAGTLQVLNEDPVYNDCSISMSPSSPALNQATSISVSGLEPDASFTIKFDYIGGTSDSATVTSNSYGLASASFTPRRTGEGRIIVSYSGVGGQELCREQFTIYESEEEAEMESQGLEKVSVNICTHIPADAPNDARSKCEGCTDGVWTALGCISINLSEFMKTIFKIAISLGGGFAFLLLIYGAFMLTTSAGDPKNAENARGIITGAITGLLVIIFAAVILQIVGVEILQIPEF